MRSRKVRIAVVALLAIIGLGLVGQSLWIPLKAELAQWLLQRAWAQTQVSGQRVKPWPWADHYPVARLLWNEQGIDQIVLAGDSGNVLAFAPGENLTARGIEHAARIISGHRDTHFRFLQRVERGELFTLEGEQDRRRYRVSDIRVVDADRVSIDPSDAPDTLLLVTCYPFDALTAGGSLRYVVSAVRVETDNVAQAGRSSPFSGTVGGMDADAERTGT